MSIQWKKSACPYCGIGCGLMVGTNDGHIVEIQGMKEHPANRGNICALPYNLPTLFTAEGRLTHPMIRRGNDFDTVEWNEAIPLVANELNRIAKKYGTNAIAMYGGAANLTEEYYLMNKLMKASIGSNNLECTARLCMASSAMGFISTLGSDAPPTCYADIDEADLFFIAGNNMAVSLPILFRRMHAARVTNNAKVIVVDPRRSETASIADIHLQIRPGTDVALNNGLAHVLFKEGLVREADVNSYTTGLTDLKEALEEYTPSRVAQITGCAEMQIIETARVIGRAKAMLTFWFQGYNQSTQAVFKNNTLHNLSLLTGNFCRKGAGPLSITGEANTMGCRWVGALSHLLPGLRMVTNPKHRREVAAFWGIPVEKIQPTAGRSIMDIIRGIRSGEIRALWVIASNPAASLPDTRMVEECLSKAEFLVAQDIFHPTETTMMADVILPGAMWSEKTGTFISSERRVELVEKLVEPPGQAKSDVEIICMVARAMGFTKEFPYTSPEEIFEEWKKITRRRICDTGGVSYERLRNGVGPQLPCPDINHPGTPRLFTDMRFPRPDGRAALIARTYKEPSEVTDDEYPLVLNTGRISCHFNTRTRTGRIPRLNNIEPDNFIEIHPTDATRYGISDGNEVDITSRRGSVRGTARIRDRVLVGTIFMSPHYGRAFSVNDGRLANIVCNPAYDVHSKQPELKYCAVKVAKVQTRHLAT